MNILAIIPARGGSKGIPRKNVRLLNNKPLISYAINNALNSEYISDVYVSTDDAEISTIAKKYKSKVLDRNSELAQDKVTLDPVIHDAVNRIELKENIKFDIVITMQATSPLLKVETIDAAIKYFIENKADTLISVVNKPHLSWTKDNNGKIIPNYKERLNRQELPANYLETGAFVITKREYVKENTRFGPTIDVYEVSENESIDIDNYNDWTLCESILNRKKIILRCDGYKLIGMGHIYHCLTLAYHLTGHDIIFVLNKNHEEGIKKIQESFFKYEVIENNESFYKLLSEIKPDIIVNDCLDTEKEYIEKLKTLVPRVVTIEDMGNGAKEADICINALYENQVGENILSGHKYVGLREEFIVANEHKPTEKVNNILVLFGGTDPSNLTQKIYNIALNMGQKDLKFTFITGIGYDSQKNNIVTNDSKNIFVYNNIKNISSFMEQSDIAITSQGRTVYELASIGVPSIVLAQNERELKHEFACENNGFINLGLGKNVSEEQIKIKLNELIQNFEQRKEMNRKMLSKDLKSGISREIKAILESE